MKDKINIVKALAASKADDYLDGLAEKRMAEKNAVRRKSFAKSAVSKFVKAGIAVFGTIAVYEAAKVALNAKIADKWFQNPEHTGGCPPDENCSCLGMDVIDEVNEPYMHPSRKSVHVCAVCLTEFDKYKSLRVHMANSRDAKHKALWKKEKKK